MPYVTVLHWQVPDGHVAFIKSVHQALESPNAYDDCDVRLWYRGEEDEWWWPEKAEVTPVSIALTEEEKFEVQVQNNGIITHYCDAEITGYLYAKRGEGKGQRGFRVFIGKPLARPISMGFE